MATSPNGRSNGHIPHASHRADEVVDLVFRKPSASPGGPAGGGNPESSRDFSGRRFVLTAIFVIAGLWLALFLMFHQWRSRYYARAAFGARQVAPVIDGMGAVDPPGVSRDDWEDAVRRTHALIVTATDSNLLSIDQMNDLRGELSATVGRALDHPDTAVAELGKVWDSLARRGAFLLRDTTADNGVRHIRPAILPPPAAVADHSPLPPSPSPSPSPSQR